MVLLVSDEADSGSAQDAADAIADMQATSVFFLANLSSVEPSYVQFAVETSAAPSHNILDLARCNSNALEWQSRTCAPQRAPELASFAPGEP